MQKVLDAPFESDISNFKHVINPDESCNRGFMK